MVSDTHEHSLVNVPSAKHEIAGQKYNVSPSFGLVFDLVARDLTVHGLCWGW